MSGVTAALAGAGLGGSLLSGLLGAKGAKSAAQASERSTAEAIAAQREMFDRFYNDPFNVAARSQGQGALEQLSKNVLAGQYSRPYTQQDFQASPLYGALTNAYKDIGNTMSARAAASGMLGSGNMQSALQQAGQQAAAQYEPLAFNQYMAQQQAGYNALRDVAGIGQQQMNALMGAGGQAAGNIGQWGMRGGEMQGQMDLQRYLMYGNMMGPLMWGLGNLGAGLWGGGNPLWHSPRHNR